VFNPRLFCAALLLIVLAGCSPAAVATPAASSPAQTAAPAPTVRPTATPSQAHTTATATSVPATTPITTPATTPPSASPTAEAVTTIGTGDGALSAGTYRLDLAQASTFSGVAYPAVLLTVPAGWSSHGGWLVNSGAEGAAWVAVQFWDVLQVYGQACQWDGTLFQPGSTVDDLATALVARPLRNATPPVPVTIDGFSGKYLEWSVPTNADFTQCDVDAGTHYFESWTGPGGGDRYQQGPGQVDQLSILNVNGSRLVIDAFFMPGATAADRQQLADVVQSIKFEPPNN